MTEAKWLSCAEGRRMLEYLLDISSAPIEPPSLRQLRLFAVAVARATQGQYAYPDYPAMIEWAEQSTEGRALPSESPYWVMNPDAEMAAWQAMARSLDTADTLREIVGNPFRPVARVAPESEPHHVAYVRRHRPDVILWSKAWVTPLVLSLAQAAYDARLLPSGHLDPACLAVLSDALEEAGCSDPDVLAHLRSPGPHVRGCWALDLVLGKQ